MPAALFVAIAWIDSTDGPVTYRLETLDGATIPGAAGLTPIKPGGADGAVALAFAEPGGAVRLYEVSAGA